MLLASFFTTVKNYFQDNPTYFWIAVVAAAIIIVLIIALIVTGVKRSKKKKAARSAARAQAPAPKTAQSQPKPAEKTAQEGSADPFAPSKAKPVQPAAANEDVFAAKVAQPAKQPQTAAPESKHQEPEPRQKEPAAVFETAPEPLPARKEPAVSPAQNADETKASAPINEPVTQQPAPQKAAESSVAKEDKPAPKKAAAPQPAAKPESPAKPAQKPVKAAEPASDEEAERRTPYSGKWLIFKRDDGSFYFELRASNGEKLLGSIDYSSMQGAKAGIRTYKNNIAKDNFTIAQSKTGQFFFKLLSGSRQMLCTGETYSTRSRCENAVESVKRFAETAVVTVAAENDEDRD